MSAWLDAHPELLDAVAADLGAEDGPCRGLSCETVLRCAVPKHLRQETWRGSSSLCGTRNRRGASRAWTRRGDARPVGRALGPRRRRMRRPAAPRDGPGNAPRPAWRDGAGDRKGREPVRAAHRHRAQGRPQNPRRPQGQSRYRTQRPGARRGGGGRQSARQHAWSTTARRRRAPPSTPATRRGTTWPRPRRSACGTPCSTRRAASRPRT